MNEAGAPTEVRKNIRIRLFCRVPPRHEMRGVGHRDEVHAYDIDAVDLPVSAIPCGGVRRRGGGINPDRSIKSLPILGDDFWEPLRLLPLY